MPGGGGTSGEQGSGEEEHQPMGYGPGGDMVEPSTFELLRPVLVVAGGLAVPALAGFGVWTWRRRSA